MLRQATGNAPLVFREKADGVWTANPFRLFFDLRQDPRRGREQAELLRKEVLAGAEMLVIPSAWPRVRIDHYLSLLKARAIENLCYVISANKVGKNALGMTYGGHSVVYDPWGRKLGELGSGPGILRVTLDLRKVQNIRRSFPVFKARREKAYRASPF